MGGGVLHHADEPCALPYRSATSTTVDMAGAARCLISFRLGSSLAAHLAPGSVQWPVSSRADRERCSRLMPDGRPHQDQYGTRPAAQDFALSADRAVASGRADRKARPPRGISPCAAQASDRASTAPPRLAASPPGFIPANTIDSSNSRSRFMESAVDGPRSL